MSKILEKFKNKFQWGVISNIDEYEEGVLRGWAHTIRNESLKILLKINDDEIIEIEANTYRQDLADVGKVGGNCAFNVNFLQYLKTRTLYNLKLVAKGLKNETVIFEEFLILTDRVVLIEKPEEQFKSYFQKIEGAHVTGWISFGASLKPICLDILIDGELADVVLTNNTRKDLKDAGIAGEHVAFSYKIPVKYADSTRHNICIIPTGTNKLINGAPKDFFIKKSSVYSNKAIINKLIQEKDKPKKARVFRGSVDKLKNGRMICGWATDGVNKNVTIEVLIDTKVIGEVVAGAFRSDLKDAGINEGNAAFELMPPARMFDGKKHTISIKDKVSGELIAIRKDVELRNDRNYKDFHEYLRWSYFNKEIYAPFAEEDKRCLSYMDWYVKRQRLKKECLSKKPLISIIMPTYKRAAVIMTAINSVLKQSYDNWELIVVDDGGNDKTDVVLAGLNEDRIKYYELPENKGVSTARNKALELSNGEYICYLDSDNTWHEDFLLIMALGLIENSTFDSAYCAQYLFRGTQEKPYAMRYGMFNKTLLKNRNYIDMNCLMHKRSLYLELGGFDTKLRRLVDWDLLLRYTENTAPLTVPAILSNYYFNEGEETITVSESLTDAVKGLVNKDIVNNKISILNHEKISFSSDGGATESVLTGVSCYSPKLAQEDELIKKFEQTRKSAIVVVSFNIPGIFKECLDSILSTVDLEKTEIIIVDNLSNQETVDLITEYNDRYPQIKLKLNDFNFGFTHAVNQGIEMASDDADIVLINNDSIATPGWLSALENVVVNNPDVGIVAPQQVLLPNTKTMNQHSPFANAGNELDVTVSYHHDNLMKVRQTPDHLIDVHFIPFFCVYIPRETIDEIGVLDAELGRHYRSDRLYCNAVIQYAGKRIVYTPASKLYHLHQQSTSSLKKKDDKEYKEMFTENKWTENDLYKKPIWEL